MSAFEIVMICIGFLTLCTGIVTSFTKTMVEIAKLQVEIKTLQTVDTQNEKAVLKLEARNSIEHDKILTKIDELIQRK